MSAKPIPDGYHSLTPYLPLRDAASALEWYGRVFNAKEKLRYDMPGGKVGHAEIEIGDSVLMLADEHPELDFSGPVTRGGASSLLMLYVEDVDALFRKAIDAGATELRPLENQFYGDRSATIRDPFGHVWTIATHVEDVSEDEMQRRMAEMENKG